MRFYWRGTELESGSANKEIKLKDIKSNSFMIGKAVTQKMQSFDIQILFITNCQIKSRLLLNGKLHDIKSSQKHRHRHGDTQHVASLE